jgi:predicted metal-binding membrane protein
MSFVALMTMWAVMMVAMMAPAVAPVALAHRFVTRRRNEGLAPTLAFVLGFLTVWSLVGFVYLVPFLWFRGLSAGAGESGWLPTLAGALLVLAGAYQFTRRKARCQQACGTPFALVLDHDAGGGVTGGYRTGLLHGVHCLGCCWALMVVLLVVGLMNLAAMVALSLLFVVEKHSRRALQVGRVAGAALVVLGLAVMARPSVLHAVSLGAQPSPPAAEHADRTI